MDALLVGVLAFSVLTLLASVLLAFRSLTEHRRLTAEAEKAAASAEAFESSLLKLQRLVEADDEATRAEVLAANYVAVLRKRVASTSALDLLWEGSQRARMVSEAVGRGAISTEDADFFLEDIEVAQRAGRKAPGTAIGKHSLAHT
jgi:hypothetical protein